MQYLLLTLKHKWFVFLAGLKLGVPVLQLILHDISKLMPWELPHYQRQFFGKANDPKGFINCWIHHQNHNKHHWEYWIPRTGHNRCNPQYPDDVPVEMPERYVKEMIADWLGAGRAYEGKWPDQNWKWFEVNYPKIRKRLHKNTDYLIAEIVIKKRLFDLKKFCCYRIKNGGCSRHENPSGQCIEYFCVFGFPHKAYFNCMK